MNESYELEIQRLIDLQLDGPARRELLGAAEKDPEIWRDIALAFVEQQVWQDQIRKDEATRDRQAESAVAPSLHKPVRDSSTTLASRWLLMAAGVLFAATLLMQWESYWRTTAPSSSSVAEQEETPHESEHPSNYASQPYTLELGNDRRTKLYDHQNLEAMLKELKKFPVDSQMQQQFAKAGFELTPDIQFYIGEASDGRQMIVPVQRLHIQPAFQ